MGVVVNVSDMVSVWDFASVEGPVVPTGAPTVFFLGDEV